MSKRADRLKTEIVLRRVREMYPMGFTVQDISAVVNCSDKHIRNLILREFPQGRPQTEEAKA